MSILMEVWGERACFTRPEMKTERVSYDVPTPSAARGMIESVYFHPGMKWIVDRIWVLNPIRFVNVRRNEVKSKILASSVMQEANGGRCGGIYTTEDIQQRLQDRRAYRLRSGRRADRECDRQAGGCGGHAYRDASGWNGAFDKRARDQNALEDHGKRRWRRTV